MLPTSKGPILPRSVLIMIVAEVLCVSGIIDSAVVYGQPGGRGRGQFGPGNAGRQAAQGLSGGGPAVGRSGVNPGTFRGTGIRPNGRMSEIEFELEDDDRFDRFDRDEPFGGPFRNDQQSVIQQQRVAQKLRAIAARNGNSNLLQVADQMEQRAAGQFRGRPSPEDRVDVNGDRFEIDDQYEDWLDQQADRQERLRELSEENLAERGRSPAPPGRLESGQGSPPSADAPHATLEQRLIQEDLRLQQQLDVAQKLRDIAARNGNDNLIRTAERLETMAADRYQRQLEKWNLLEDSAVPAPPAPAPAIP